jgi:hypothetical protein
VSIHARGIVLSGEFGKLVVEASDGEVERFGKGALVEVVQKQTAPKREHFNRYFYGPAWPTMTAERWDGQATKHNAILHTACGATRELTVPTPYPRDINIAISASLKPHVVPTPSPINSFIRRFALKDVRRDTAEYEEVL